MKPLKIEFQAFGPYKDYEMVDFETLSSKGLFLICGKTGIGKTMILDAMTFALFGKSSGNGRNDFEGMRCTNASFDQTTFVRFEFENNGACYRFERRLERKIKNLTSKYDVSRKDDEGIWRTLMENAKERDLNAKAEEIIGLKYDQFRQVIVLPQGQFEKLLVSNSDEKEVILTSIFGEEKWKIIAERFYQNAAKRRDELKEVQNKINNSLSEENCKTIEQLESVINSTIEQKNEQENDYKRAGYEKIIKEQQTLLTLANRFGDLHKAEDKVNGLELKKEERKSWEKDLEEAKRAEKMRGLIETLNGAINELKNRKDEEKEAKEEAKDSKKLLEQKSKELSDLLEKEKEIDQLKKKMTRYEEKKENYSGLEEIERKLEDGKKKLDEAIIAEEKARKKYNSFADLINQSREEYGKASEEHECLLNSYLAGITGEIARELKTGQPCPVCGSIEHPKKAMVSDDYVTKEEVDNKKKESDDKYKELQEQIDAQGKAKTRLETIHSEVETAKLELSKVSSELENKKENLVSGFETLSDLEEEIEMLCASIEEYEERKTNLIRLERDANEAYMAAKAKIESATKETSKAEEKHREAQNAVEEGLIKNDFPSVEKVLDLMMTEEERDELASKIANYDAEEKNSKNRLEELKVELKGREEPDKEKTQAIIDATRKTIDEYLQNTAVLEKEIERIEKKLQVLKTDGDGIEEKTREADEDFAFAKSLRGDTGTGLQRYVLGIMFSSVVAAANQMLEKVHGGRYRLYRTDEKAKGSNKRGLELKVFDNNSEDHDGRFVNTLSGGEKFLVSLALSIGVSTVAQKGGIKIDALFIDEGFGSLDDDSIGDAMSILNSIQEANGLVGIISHVQLLQDQIPIKLRVIEENGGSHIVQTVG
ncbi:MAG: SMC family ATPase [Eubacterium sp.]|nr:SMC family ATPase [Eubacterium sp.]